MILQDLPHHIYFQELQLALIGDPVTGIQIDPVKIVLNHIGAEAMDGADAGMVQQGSDVYKRQVRGR